MEFLQRAKQAGPQYITHPEVGALARNTRRS
jgi:hypothetical protein